MALSSEQARPLQVFMAARVEFRNLTSPCGGRVRGAATAGRQRVSVCGGRQTGKQTNILQRAKPAAASRQCWCTAGPTQAHAAAQTRGATPIMHCTCLPWAPCESNC